MPHMWWRGAHFFFFVESCACPTRGSIFFCFLPPFFLFLYCLHSFRTFTLIFFSLLSVTDRRKVNFLLHSSFCFPPYLCVASHHSLRVVYDYLFIFIFIYVKKGG
ncbi:hypothetical protein, unlikely [Trypanosoma brucei gambiense DAL972]|uniref:Uncharacterized protein n=1 Tax=Trypanosoma brucei gambiense (strain MHOM/CI/86/DAL972) TaxID=679716 RepID=D0A234_TRYB9|nr:hypothetical protein, unlikely [Trypanosoma brucei gambiense DAL972]CBH15327.1 hypothetical protein, unlikely [Trypanosoma brucei gambiense DAL972]|eukprot:XP_011777592.1 hypothetical protein, unlikely [Trypanosoma brucei gambiense DAL972]